MLLEWKTKRFETLSLEELYQILKLRSEVFVVEQNCVYLDIDDKDKKALHVLGSHDGKIIAYARLFKPNDYFEEAKGDAETVGGLVVELFGRIPKVGEEVALHHFKFKVLSFKKNRIEKLKIFNNTPQS